MNLSEFNKKMLLFLAPMEGITNQIYRDLIIEIGGVDIVATEFIRISQENQRIKQIDRPKVPIQIQFMASCPKTITKCIENLKKQEIILDDDWIDFNIGCPSKKVNSKGAGAALLLEPNKIIEITKNIRSIHSKMFSVKTRLGFQNDENFEDILDAFNNCPIDFITIHARTRCGGYTEPVNLKKLSLAAKTLNYPVIGNGDVFTKEAASEMMQTGVRGIMIGRGAIQNPFIFKDITYDIKINKEERIVELLNFALLLMDTYLKKYERTPQKPVGRYKEFSIWFSRNPLVGLEYFHSIKRETSLFEIRKKTILYFEKILL